MFVYSLRIMFFLSRIYASKARRVAVATTITADIAVLTVSKSIEFRFEIFSFLWLIRLTTSENV